VFHNASKWVASQLEKLLVDEAISWDAWGKDGLSVRARTAKDAINTERASFPGLEKNG
jgi:hypothetical protein